MGGYENESELGLVPVFPPGADRETPPGIRAQLSRPWLCLGRAFLRFGHSRPPTRAQGAVGQGAARLAPNALRPVNEFQLLVGWTGPEPHPWARHSL